MKNKLFILAIGVAGMFLALFLYLKDEFKSTSPQNQSALQNSNNKSAFKMTPVEPNLLIKSHSPTKGATSAKVTVVEFLDPECESCSAMYPLVKKIYEEYKSDIKLVVRYMVFHQNSKYVANILEGARLQNKYWEALELLFETQSQWADHQNPKIDLIPDILKPLNLNMKKIILDAKNGKYDKQIMEDFEDGKKAGVNGTPTFYVNGYQLYELGYESLKNEIESRLKQQ